MRRSGLFGLVGLLVCGGCSSSLRVGVLPDDGGTEGADDGASTEDTGAGVMDAAADEPSGDEVTPDAAGPAMGPTLADAGGDASEDATAGDEPDATTEDVTIHDGPPGDAPGDAVLDTASEATIDGGSADAGLDVDAAAPTGDAGTISDDGPAEAQTEDAGSADGSLPIVDAAGERMRDAPADAAVVTPISSGGHYVFAWGNLLLEIDPQTGGRVLTFSLAGQNVLTGPSVNAINYGSTFWTSPQSDWSWPPVPEIDNLPYSASIDGGTLTLHGSTSAALGVAITKAFSVNAATGAVSIAYTITNLASAARSFAPWEVTRVRPSGLMFFPSGATAYSADSGPPLPTTQAGGATWFSADTAATSADTKFFATAARGWLAQASSGLLFVKKFPDVSAGPVAPGEAEVEMFASGDRAYVELEAQGAYAPIAPSAALSWTTTWFLTELPANVDAGLGSASLVAFVDAL